MAGTDRGRGERGARTYARKLRQRQEARRGALLHDADLRPEGSKTWQQR